MGCGSSTASSNGAAYRSHTPATKDDETRDAVTESLPMKKSIPLAQTANTTGTGAARSSVTNSTAHQMDRRAERSHISLTASKNGSIPEEAMSEQDMQMYEQLVIDANPAPLVLHPPNTYNPPPVDIQTVAMRSIDTAAHVADVANGGYVLLSHKAEEMIAASVTDSVAHAASLSDEEDNSAGVVNILRVLDRIFAVWNTKPQIPHLHFDPSIQRGSIIGGQTGFISPLTTPTNKSNNPMGTPKNSATPAGSLLSPFSLGGGVASNSTAQTKTDPKPVYVGEYIAFLKVWEAELVRDHAQYALPANRQYLAAALESAGALENIISMAITRGTFLKHMYVAQDQYLLSTHRFDAIRNLRDRVKVAAGRGAQDISEAEVELSKRFTTYSEALETQTLFQTALQPLDFSLDITTELNRYIQGTRLTVCRAFWQWVHVNTAMPSYEEELAEQAGSLIRASAAMLLRRVFWIKGSAGVGKTNQSALLAELFHEQILAVHFVKHDYEERKNPIRMIRNIAYQLSQRIPEYSKELKKRLEKIAANTASGGAGSAVLHHPIASPAHASSPTNASTANASANGSADKDAAVGLPILASPSAYLDSLSALDLFDQLLTQPLQAIKQPASIAKDKKMVILVDAIDEAERESTSSSSRRRMEGKTPAAATDESESGNENLLLKILLQQVQLLPTWVGLCLTSRSNEQIVQALSKSRPTEISCDSRDNLSDLRKIVTTMLQPVVAASELEEAVEIVVKKSEGTILYIRLVLDDRLSKLHQGHFDRSQAALPETVGSATLGGSKPSTPPANASHANSGGSGGGLGSPNSPVIDAAVANGENPPMMTLADIKAFPEGLHAYYAEALEGVAAFLAQYKQPLSHVMQIVQLLVCSMEPLTPSLLAQLQYGPSGAPTTGSVASFAKEKGETLIIRTLNPLRALFPYRLLDATRACRGKYSIVHKSLRDYLVDSSRLEKRKESSFHVSLRQGHSRLAERCWHALQAPMSAAEGEPGQAIPKSILSEPFGAAQSRDEALQKQNQANGGAELPPSLVPVHAPFLRLDDVLLGNHPCPSSSDDESAASEAVEGVAPEDAYTKGPERDGVLSYAIRHGPAHAIQSDDLCGTASFLCHLQYLHLRVALGEASLLSLDYINAARQINSRARGWTAEKRLDVPSAASRHVSAAGATSGKNADLKQANWVWLQPMDSASGIINFQCFFQQELPHWLGNKELIYQYALAFPDDTLVCRVARSLMSWYLNAWSGRKMGLVHWNNKPQALGALMITLRGHQASVQALSYSPDGRTLASASFDRSIRLWNAETGELRTELKGHGYHINTVAYSPDGKRIASGGSDNQIRLWDTATNECIRVLQGDDVWFNSVQFSPDGKKLACGVSDWAVWIFDLSTFEVEMKLEGHKDKIYSVCYSPDGKLIASGSEDETIRLWASSSGKLVHEIKEGHSKGVLAVQFDVDGVRMLSSGLDGVVRLWSCEDWSLLQEFKGHEKGAYGVAFHPDQIRVISASYDRKVKIWNSLNGQLLHTLHGHAEEVNAVVVSPNGARIASCSADRSIMLWDSQLEVTVSSLAQASCEGKSHTGSIYSINASADGKKLVSCGEDKMLKVWSMDGDLLCELKGHKEGVLAATFLNDGTRIASGSTDSTIRFWNVQTGKEEADLKVKDKTGFVWTLVASPNGKQLVSGSTDANLRVWNANDGSLIRIIKGPKGMIYSVAYSTDGKRLVCGSETKVVRVYDADSGDLKMELAGHTGDIHSVCFSPDNKIIASGSYDKSIGIWDATTGKSIRYLQGHTGWVNSIAISPNNKYLVSGGADATIRVWSLATGEQVSILTGHSDSVLFVKFSADGSQILSTGKHRDQTFRVWKFAPDEPSAAAAAAALTSAISPVHTNGFSSNTHVPVSVPIGANMAKNFDFRTDKGSLVAGCLQVSCHT